MDIVISYDDVLRMMRIEPSLLDTDAEEELKRGIEAFQTDIQFSYYERVVNIADTQLTEYPDAVVRLNGCAQALVGVSTIGEKASDRIKRANAGGDYLGAIAYDMMANYYISQYHCLHMRSVREGFIKNGWYLTKEITPGNNTGLSLQKEIFRLLPDIDICLTDSLLMVPVKSLSYVYGITSVPNRFSVSHDCTECMAKNCPYRGRHHVN